MTICAYFLCDLTVPIRLSTHGGAQPKYCSKEHKKLFEQNSRKAKRRIWHEIKCRGCNIRFSTFWGTVEYCDEKCRIRFNRKKENYKKLANIRNRKYYQINKVYLNKKKTIYQKLICECGNKKEDIDNESCNICKKLNIIKIV